MGAKRSQRSWPIGQTHSNVKLLAQYLPLGQHLVPNQRKKLSGQDLAIFVTKKIIKNVKNRGISSLFKIVKYRNHNNFKARYHQ